MKKKANRGQVQPVVKRFPIVLNAYTIAVIHIFTRHDCLEDLWMSDCFHGSIETQEIAAQQMIDQLQEWWTPAFLIALRKAITKELKKHDKQFGTKFA